MRGKRPPSRKPLRFSCRRPWRKPPAASRPSGLHHGPGRRPKPSKELTDEEYRRYFKAVTAEMEHIRLQQCALRMAVVDADEALSVPVGTTVGNERLRRSFACTVLSSEGFLYEPFFFCWQQCGGVLPFPFVASCVQAGAQQSSQTANFLPKATNLWSALL